MQAFPQPDNEVFLERIEELSGQKLSLCHQCGKCSAGCPGAPYMDVLPNRVIRRVQIGDMGILDSKTIWICASCFICDTRCPRGLEISRIMEALRICLLRKGVDHIHISSLPLDLLDKIPQQGLVSCFRKHTS